MGNLSEIKVGHLAVHKSRESVGNTTSLVESSLDNLIYTYGCRIIGEGRVHWCRIGDIRKRRYNALEESVKSKRRRLQL